eukprot:3758519-Pleurochrysis_carterae.AAC.2
MALKRMRQEYPPQGTRELSRGFCAAHFRQVSNECDWRQTARERVEWAAALLAHNLLLRSGEVGHPQDRAFDPTRDLPWGSVQ